MRYFECSRELTQLKKENEWLRDFLEIKNLNTTFEFADATVIGKGSGAVNGMLTINKGSLHGIEVGMSVINAQGLVGRIIEVGLTSSSVMCITDASASAGAIIERSALSGIVDGYSNGKCRFLYTTGLSDFDAIAEGDTVITSGKGSIYPYGLKIGTVVEVKIDDASRSVIATVETAVNFNDIDRVMIIKSFTIE